MCGIAGILRNDGEPIGDDALDRLDAAIAARGPDGHGRFRDRVEVDTPDGTVTVEVALVHRRLSIIDHAGGGQPMVSGRGRTDAEGLVAVVFNGCIYNHRALRAELEAAGHRFTTDHSDTEVLVHGHRAWGAGLAARLEGMYAYAIWDRAAATLTLARDRFGEKPLFCTHAVADRRTSRRATCFGSARGGLRDARRELASGADAVRGWTRDYLDRGYGWAGPDGDATPVLIERIAPGSSLRLGPAAGAPTPAAPFEETGAPLTVDRLETLLDAAVAARLEADVPLGCFLSGGVDSSLVAHFARRHRPDLRTFSVRMPDGRYDESMHAERVAKHLGTDHATLDIAMDPAADLAHLVRRLGQPFADSSILPTYWVSRAARAHVKVALSGDGGDELFVGYERYMAARTLGRFWPWLRLLPAERLQRAHPKSRLHKLGRLGVMARDYPFAGVRAMESIFARRDAARLLGAGAGAGRRRVALPADPRAALRRYDVGHYLPDDLLCKVDTASMAVALEVRCPFLDRALAGAALAAPIDTLTPGGRRKGLLRELARRHLPADAVDRPKMGFAIPIGEWFRSDYGGMKTLLMEHLMRAEPFGPIGIDRAAVAAMTDEHMDGRRDHGQRLFCLLTLAMWAGSRES